MQENDRIGIQVFETLRSAEGGEGIEVDIDNQLKKSNLPSPCILAGHSIPIGVAGLDGNVNDDCARRADMPTNYERIDGVIENYEGIPIGLWLQRRTDEGIPPFFVVSWRTRYPSGSNRRFYRTTLDGFWRLPVQVALKMLDQVHERGLLDQSYDDPYYRSGGGNPEIINSTDAENHDRNRLWTEITSSALDPEWGTTPTFVISEEPPGGLWRKILIVDSTKETCTFRSMTTDSGYRPLVSNGFSGGWLLDNSMIDASTQTMRAFLNSLS